MILDEGSSIEDFTYYTTLLITCIIHTFSCKDSTTLMMEVIWLGCLQMSVVFACNRFTICGARATA